MKGHVKYLETLFDKNKVIRGFVLSAELSDAMLGKNYLPKDPKPSIKNEDHFYLSGRPFSVQA